MPTGVNCERLLGGLQWRDTIWRRGELMVLVLLLPFLHRLLSMQTFATSVLQPSVFSLSASPCRSRASSDCHSHRPFCLTAVFCSPVLQAQFKDQTVLIGVDDMDLFKGIELKLQAVERLLEQHADWRGKLVLVQVTNAPR